MLMKMKPPSMYAISPDLQPRRRRVRQAASVPQATDVPLDADAARALAWLDAGQPQAEIVYDEAVPRQSKADLAKFRPASYRRGRDG